MRARLVPALAEGASLGKRHYVVLGELRVPRIGVLCGARTGLVGESRSGGHQHRHYRSRQNVDYSLLHAKIHPLPRIPNVLYGARA